MELENISDMLRGIHLEDNNKNQSKEENITEHTLVPVNGTMITKQIITKESDIIRVINMGIMILMKNVNN